jgi:hypothetical protein
VFAAWPFSTRIERRRVSVLCYALSQSVACGALLRFSDRQACKEGSIVNRFALAAALAIGLSGIAQAKVIDLVPQTAPGALSIHTQVGVPALPSGISELPEPEVFTMMLVGLVLLGYRARRNSREKFK